MIDVALVYPEIPPNAGNVIRLCANTGARLHLVHPLGFRTSDRALRRAGLDYHALADVREHGSLEALRSALPAARWLAFSATGATPHDQVAYRQGDLLLFGSESRGLPPDVLGALPPEQRLRIPMRAGSRSLNLANAVAIAVYEAWRRGGFAGAAPPGP